MNKQSFVIDGNNFSDEESFYTEIDSLLTKDLDWKTGHNSAAFNDILCGGFGVHEYEEPIILIWKNASKSKQELGNDLFDHFVSIIKDHEHIDFTIIE